MARLGQGGFVKAIRAAVRDDEGVAIFEFAATLPLLLVIAVIIFDLGGAFNLKQKLDNAALEAARYGSKLPTNDLPGASSAPAPNSVNAIRDFVVSYLKAANVSDCGMASATADVSGPTDLVWKYHVTCSGGGTFALFVDRGTKNASTATVTFGVTTISVLSTDVKIQYDFKWQFNNVFKLLVPGANYGTTTITTEATVPNME